MVTVYVPTIAIFKELKVYFLMADAKLIAVLSADGRAGLTLCE